MIPERIREYRRKENELKVINLQKAQDSWEKVGLTQIIENLFPQKKIDKCEDLREGIVSWMVYPDHNRYVYAGINSEGVIYFSGSILKKAHAYIAKEDWEVKPELVKKEFERVSKNPGFILEY